VAVLFGVFPAADFLSLVLSQWVIKSLMEIVLTPVTVLTIRAIKRFEGMDVVGTETWNPFAFDKDGGDNRYR